MSDLVKVARERINDSPQATHWARMPGGPR